MKTTTCRIQWIDGEGNPTPDHNPAIGYVRCLGYAVASNPNHKPTASEWYPICAEHKHVLDHNVSSVERGGRWEFSEVNPMTRPKARRCGFARSTR